MKKATSGEDKEAMRAMLQQPLTPADRKEAEEVWASMPKNEKGVVSAKHLRQFLRKKISEHGGDEHDVMHMAGRIMTMAHNSDMTASMTDRVCINKDEFLSLLGELKIHGTKEELAYFSVHQS